MSQIRKIARNRRRVDGDTPNAWADARSRVIPVIDQLVTDRELHRARYRLPLDVKRSTAKTKTWHARILQRLGTQECDRVAGVPA